MINIWDLRLSISQKLRHLSDRVPLGVEVALLPNSVFAWFRLIAEVLVEPDLAEPFSARAVCA
jgi:hypothetical protein